MFWQTQTLRTEKTCTSAIMSETVKPYDYKHLSLFDQGNTRPSSQGTSCELQLCVILVNLFVNDFTCNIIFSFNE